MKDKIIEIITINSTEEFSRAYGDGNFVSSNALDDIAEGIIKLFDIPVVSGSYVAFCDGADEGVEGLVQLSCTIDNEVDGRIYCESFKSRSPVLYKLVE